MSASSTKAYPSGEDTTARLLDRIEWASLRPKWVHWSSRYAFWAFLLTLIVYMTLYSRLPYPREIIILWFVVWLSLTSLHGYFMWHSDKFVSFAIGDSVRRLRSRLRLPRGSLNDLPTTVTTILPSDGPWTFNFRDVSL